MTDQNQSVMGGPQTTYDICYAVPRGDGENDRFVRCGHGWLCKSGKGIGFQLEAVPLNDLATSLFVFPRRKSKGSQKQISPSESS